MSVVHKLEYGNVLEKLKWTFLRRDPDGNGWRDGIKVRKVDFEGA